MSTHSPSPGVTARPPGTCGRSAGRAGGPRWRSAQDGAWRTRVAARLAILGLVCLTLVACAIPGNRVTPEVDAVIAWTMLADEFGKGGANWRTMAIMHQAMHDALNAARPVYARWSPPAAGEPPARGTVPEIAMAAAAHQTLLLLHPDRTREIDLSLRTALAPWPDGPSRDTSLQLGRAIGTAAVRRRDNDGAAEIRYFTGTETSGRWRPTPNGFATSRTETTKPFLFATLSEVPFAPPPALDSAVFLQHLDEVRRVGGAQGAQRTPDQTASALFWATQSSQRGFLHLAGHLLVGHPRPGGLQEHAWIMARLASALADSGIIVWKEKEVFGFWRPVTAIRAAGDPRWTPLAESPPFPEYPSGHAADCYVGAGMLRAAFPDLRDPVSYPWHVGTEAPHAEGSTGHHRADGDDQELHRLFATLDAAADECALSRIWAGVHFRAGDEEAKRIAGIVVKRALTMTPPLATK